MKRISTFRIPHLGFTLIEVMISLLVLALGVLAVTKLQGSFIKSGSDANQRVIAANLAQKKIDDLKSFVYIGADVDADGVAETWTSASTWPLTQQSYAFIDDNEGGVIAPGNHTVGNYTLNLAWNVTPYYYGAVTTAATSTAPATILSEFKQVNVVVTWTDESNTAASLAMSTVIDAYSSSNTGKSNSNLGGDSPIIPYTPKEAPDVIPVSLETDDGLKKETAKPLPDLSKKGDSTSVQFSTVTYNITLDTVKREDFLTLVCNCKNGTNTTSIQKAYTVWDADNKKLKDQVVQESVTSSDYSNTSVDNSGGESQAEECYICCRDSADVSGTSYKACRLKRVDGIYRIMDPWKMIAFNLIPASYFDASAALPTISASTAPSTATLGSTIADANIDRYSSYVTSLVRARASAAKATFTVTAPDTNFAPDNFQGADGYLHRTFYDGTSNTRALQARAVYMDYPPTEIYTDSCASCSTGTIADAAVVPLDRIPFFEVNVTQLAGWVPDRDDTASSSDYTQDHDTVGNSPGCNKASVPSTNFATNDEIKNGCEQSISRGEFYPLATASSEAITTLMYTSNDGVIDRKVNTSVSTATQTIYLDVK